MILRWSALSHLDRDAIFEFIKQDSPRAAIMVDERIDAHAKQLLLFPDSGRLGRVPGTRELIVPGTSYLIVYQLAGDVIRLLRILHGAQEWPGRTE